MAVGERSFRYAPRAVAALAPSTVRGWAVKRYGISETREVPPDEVLAAGMAALAETLPDAYTDAPSYAMSIVHEDGDGCYYVVAWWSPNGYILHSLVLLAGWDDVTATSPAEGHATACVWETKVLAFERDKWVDLVLRPDEPDLDGYLNATFSGKF